MYEVLIRNGRVVNGTGNPWFRADLAIEKGRIAAIGRLADEPADIVIDAEGLVVCPGFIDMHSHSDLTLLINPLAESKVRQGVTTEVTGNCGSSAAPLNDLLREEILRTVPMVREAGLELTWSTLGEYGRLLEERGISLNIAPLVGNANLRVLALGFENRPPTQDELEQMKRILAQAMKEGAFGMSTGLIYPPSCYADTKELIELARVVAEYLSLIHI